MSGGRGDGRGEMEYTDYLLSKDPPLPHPPNAGFNSGTLKSWPELKSDT